MCLLLYLIALLDLAVGWRLLGFLREAFVGGFTIDGFFVDACYGLAGDDLLALLWRDGADLACGRGRRCAW